MNDLMSQDQCQQPAQAPEDAVTRARRKAQRMSRSKKLKLLVRYKIGLIELGFFRWAHHWHRTHEVPDNMTIDELFDLVYGSFLRVPKDRTEIIEKTKTSITVRSTHDCPYLEIAMGLGMDTRVFCRSVSRRPCLYFFWRLGPRYAVENEYDLVRPHLPACQETLRIVR